MFSQHMHVKCHLHISLCAMFTCQHHTMYYKFHCQLHDSISVLYYFFSLYDHDMNRDSSVIIIWSINWILWLDVTALVNVSQNRLIIFINAKGTVNLTQIDPHL